MQQMRTDTERKLDALLTRAAYGSYNDTSLGSKWFYGINAQCFSSGLQQKAQLRSHTWGEALRGHVCSYPGYLGSSPLR